MRSFFVQILLALFTAAWSPVTRGGESPSISRGCADSHGLLVHSVRSEYQSGTTKIRILLPDKQQAGKKYRVLYVLPVETRDGNHYGDGLLECKEHGLHNKYGLICVAPTFSDLPWYADHPTDPRIRQESYLLSTVIPFVDENYSVLAEPQGRLLVGFSKSGWGAFTLLLRHPRVFGKAAAWDAPLMMQQPNKYGMGPIFATQNNFEKYQVSRLLRSRCSKFKNLSPNHVGKQSRRRPASSGGGFVKSRKVNPRLILLGYGNFRTPHQQAHALMTELGIAHEYRNGPRREHTWHGGWLPEAVKRLVAP